MAMIVIETQYLENYGSADKPYWKAKGGSTYKILGVPVDQDLDLEAVVDAAAIGYRNDFAEEFVIGWTVQADDYLSRDEELQLEYEGSITHPDSTVEYADLVEQYAE